MVTLGNLVEICIKTLNDAMVPKMTANFCKLLVTLEVGPLYQAISATAPLMI